MRRATKVLLVEDDANDAELVARALAAQDDPFDTDHVGSLDDLESRLASAPPDVILADFKLLDFTAFDILDRVRHLAPRLPVIVVTGSLDEETAVRCMHEGAADYLLKTSLGRLPHVIGAAIESARLRFENERQMQQLVSAAERQMNQLSLLGAILDSSVDPILSLDREGRYTSYNQAHALAMKRLYGTDVAVGQRLADLITVDADRERATSNVARALAGENVVDDLTLGDPRLEPREYEVGHFPVYDAHGTSIGVAIMAHDVTERRRTEELLLRAQKQESLGVLAGGVAHDFNNLLTVIMGNHSLALGEIGPDSKAAEHIRNATRAAERAATLTKQMLAYAGRGRFLNEKIDLSARVRQAAPLFESAVGRNVRIDLDLASGLPLVEGDPEQIDQVLLNLVTNASEAIGPGRGSITITTRREAITAPRGGDPQRLDGPDSTRVVLEVRDDGPGMDEETARRAFDPFFSTKFTGRGLGLAAVSGIVRAHHGEIDLRSAPGLGTRIHITLPAVPGDEAPEDPRGASLAPAVLVIDAEDDLLAVARAVLERAGYDVLTERRAENAIETFRRKRADLVAVVLDLSMPDVAGERTLQELRRIEERVPVILSSGYAESEALRRLEGARVEAFLAKPYRPESLLDVVRKVERVLPER